MTTEEAVLFLADHGVVLEADRGPVPNRVEAVVGEPISPNPPKDGVQEAC